MTAKNLWGKLDDLDKIRTPLAILREQGEFLSASTNGVLDGRLYLSKESYSGDFYIRLSIVVPTLNEYSCDVLSVTHPITFYPLKVTSDFISSPIECETEEDFIRGLEKILSSGKVRNIIQSLIAQSQS